MWCPRCGKDTRVLETDKLPDTVTRVRWCRNSGCRFLFETHEVITGNRQDAAAKGEDRPVPAAAAGSRQGVATEKNNTAPEAVR